MRNPTTVLFLATLFFAANIGARGETYARLGVVGDSISAGMNPDFRAGGLDIGTPLEDRGWAQMIAGEYGDYPTVQDLWSSMTVVNEAVSGLKAWDWAEPGYAPMARLLAARPDLVIVFIGGNDFIAYVGDGGLSDDEADQYVADLNTIVDRLRAELDDPRILLVGYYDLFDGLSNELPWLLFDYRAMSAAALKGNGLIAEVAEAKDCDFIDGVYAEFLDHCYGEDLDADTHLDPDYVDRPLYPYFDIHPNTAGHEAIHGLVYAHLEELSQPEPTPTPTATPTESPTQIPIETPTPTPAPAEAERWMLYR